MREMSFDHSPYVLRVAKIESCINLIKSMQRIIFMFFKNVIKPINCPVIVNNSRSLKVRTIHSQLIHKKLENLGVVPRLRYKEELA